MKALPRKICLLLFSRLLSTRQSVVLPAVNLSEDMLHSWVVLFTFLSELKAAFIRTLKLDDEHIIDTDNSHLFAAIGSALNAKEEVIFYHAGDDGQDFLPILRWNLK